MKQFLLGFSSWFWFSWLLILVVFDPIDVWLGRHFGEGDKYTATHFIATHISMQARVIITSWLVYHFFVAHRNG